MKHIHSGNYSSTQKILSEIILNLIIIILIIIISVKDSQVRSFNYHPISGQVMFHASVQNNFFYSTDDDTIGKKSETYTTISKYFF
jgi:hypothetical protein